MTERQEREYEQLKSFEDYTDLIKELDDLASSVSNGEVIDKEISKSIECVSRAMRQKVKYIVNISKSWRRKQSWLSAKKDKRLEKEIEEQNKALELMEKRFKNKQLPLPQEDPKITFWGKIKAIFCKKSSKQALQCPEQLKNAQDEPKDEEIGALECDETAEINEDEEILIEKNDDIEPEVIEEDCLDF